MCLILDLLLDKTAYKVELIEESTRSRARGKTESEGDKRKACGGLESTCRRNSG